MYRVIAADDEPMMRKGLRALVDWEALDCTLVDVSENGEQALEAVITQHPDILICDIKMPKKSGIDVAREIYNRHLPVKIILLTAYADFSYARQAIQYNVSDYVTKTGALDEIIAAVKKCTAQLAQERSKKTVNDRDPITFLKAVLDGVIFEQNHILECAEELELNFSRYTLLSVMLSDDQDDTKVARFSENVRQMLAEMTELYPCHIVPLGRARICAVFCGASPESLLQSCQALVQAFEAFCGGRLYLGLSRAEHSLIRLPQALICADEALERCFFDRSTSVFIWEPSEYDASDTAVAAAEAVALSLTVSENDVVQAALDRFLSSTCAQRSSPKAVRGNGVFLINTCHKQLLLLGIEAEEIASTCTRAKLAVRECRFWEEYCDEITRFFWDCRERMSDISSSGAGTIAAAQAYIDRNFHRTVTLGEIAEAVGANPSYLSRTFKIKTGMSIIDTLNARRIAKAKELLNLGQLKIYEVAQSVGIEDTTYFSHLFRRYTGVSPKAYQSTGDE